MHSSTLLLFSSCSVLLAAHVALSDAAARSFLVAGFSRIGAAGAYGGRGGGHGNSASRTASNLRSLGKRSNYTLDHLDLVQTTTAAPLPLPPPAAKSGLTDGGQVDRRPGAPEKRSDAESQVGLPKFWQELENAINGNGRRGSGEDNDPCPYSSLFERRVICRYQRNDNHIVL